MVVLVVVNFLIQAVQMSVARRTRIFDLATTGRIAWFELQKMNLELVSLIVDDYDEAIAFFVNGLRFKLATDEPSLTNDGRPKRWVVVQPPNSETGILLAKADGNRQSAAVGNQFAGRVGLFLRVKDFDEAYDHMVQYGVTFFGEPRIEPYGKIVVFQDIVGNRWDLLGPP